MPQQKACARNQGQLLNQTAGLPFMARQYAKVSFERGKRGIVAAVRTPRQAELIE